MPSPSSVRCCTDQPSRQVTTHLGRRSIGHIERDDDARIGRDELNLLPAAVARVVARGLVLGRQLVPALPNACRRFLHVLEEDVLGRTGLHAAESVARESSATHRLKNRATPSRPSLTQYCSTRPLWTFCRQVTASPFIAALNAATSMASVLRGWRSDGSFEMAPNSLSHLLTGILAKLAALADRLGTSSSESSPDAAGGDAEAAPLGLSTSIALPLPLTSAAGAGAAGRFGSSTICLVAASLLTCCGRQCGPSRAD